MAAGDEALVRLLLNEKRQASQERRNQIDLNKSCLLQGWRPLHYAAVSGSSKMVTLLLENGARYQLTTDPITAEILETPLELLTRTIKEVKRQKVIHTCVCVCFSFCFFSRHVCLHVCVSCQ